ncbi:MAG: hypothetical protein HC844_10860, partial [Tabrizicola sp.]|nr:hypothetical protein [Tabrizicola sp.]
MGRAYSQDLRRRVCDYVAAGHSCRAAGRVFGVSASTGSAAGGGAAAGPA